MSSGENAKTIAAYDAGVAAYLNAESSTPSALARWLAEVADDVFPPGTRVLEIGAGGGRDAHYLQEAGFDVLPTDASQAFVDHLRGTGFPDAVRYDIRRDAPPVTDVGIVFGNGVFPHLRRGDAGEVLRRFSESFGDDVVLMLSVKMGDGEGWSTEKLGTKRWYTYWQPEQFVRLLWENGWAVEDARMRSGKYDDWVSIVAVPQRSAVREAFDERARTYAQGHLRPRFAEELVAALPLEPGMRVLDVAAGTGFTTRAIARRVGARGDVTAVDLSEEMLGNLLSHDPEDGAAPIRAFLGDAMHLQARDGMYDAVVCGAGLLYMDPTVALAEWHRVLRPGGFVGFSTLFEHEPPSGRLFRDLGRSFGLDLPDPWADLGSPERCTDALTRAGFRDAHVTEGAIPMSTLDLQQEWDDETRMARAHLATMPPEDRGRFRAAYVAELELRARTDPDFPLARTLYAFGRKP